MGNEEHGMRSAEAVSLENLLHELDITRRMQPGEDPRRKAREAGPEVSYGLPHRGERRRGAA